MSTRDVPAQIGDLPPIARPAGRALLAAEITSLDDVAALGRRGLLAMHGVGPKAVGLLESAAADRGIAFAP